MIVVDDVEKFDPAIDHVRVVARSGPDPAAPNVLIPTVPVVLNGESAARYVWKAGQRHRVTAAETSALGGSRSADDCRR
jgi:hypothetical protein